MTDSLVSTLGLTGNAARTSPQIPHDTVRDSEFDVNVRKQIHIGPPDHRPGVAEMNARMFLPRMSIDKSGYKEPGISFSDDTISGSRFAFHHLYSGTMGKSESLWVLK